MLSDKEIVDQIEDFIVNNYEEDTVLTLAEAYAMLDHITTLVEKRGQ